jgi:hypothetical protein
MEELAAVHLRHNRGQHALTLSCEMQIRKS